MAALAANLGCGSVLGIDDLVADRAVGGGGAGASGGGGSGGGSGGSGGGCADVCGTPGCGECPADSSVDIADAQPSYRIDAFEVTNAQYQAFLEADVSTGMQDPACAHNGSFTPGVVSQVVYDQLEEAQIDAGEVLASADDCLSWLDDELSTLGQDRPMACIDQCDAIAYCRWAGKRLCGDIAGGFLDVTQGEAEGRHVDPAESAWYRACSSAGATLYPYGDTFEEARCIDAGLSPNRTYDVGSYDNCEGGYSGIFDMSGNIGEWVDECTRYGGPSAVQNCLVRGGAYYNGLGDESTLTCTVFKDTLAAAPSDATGFRCCSD